MSRLELFQFEIDNLSFEIPNKFTSGFGKASKDQCGTVSIDQQQQKKQEKTKTKIKSSCDFLDSQSNGSVLTGHFVMDSVYTNCLQIRSKLDQANLTAAENQARNNWAAENKKLLLETVNQLTTFYRQDLRDNDFVLKNDKPVYYVRVLSIRKKSKVIIIGDVHGSMHTLLRHLHRFAIMGFLNIETLEMKSNIKLIFLGDIVDRGIGNMEVLMMIFYLMVKNINQVFYNRGNHETRDINIQYGLKQELDHRNSSDLFEPINRLFDLFSCAIVLKLTDSKKNEKIWLCHGGFESTYISKQKFNFKDAFVPIFEKKETNHDLIVPFEPQSKQIVGTLWNDFTETEENDSERGEGIINYNRYDLTQFLDNNDLTFVIRGHQDRHNNSYLFGPNFQPKDKPEEVLSGYGLNYLKKTSIFGKKK